jgi:putative ABC transport system substrate-binding protein
VIARAKPVFAHSSRSWQSWDGTDGGNIQFDERWPADNMDLVQSHAASLVASNPDIIVVAGGRIVPVLMRLTRSIPVVLPGASDPVGVGWAQSLARPGGNVTGFTGFELSMLGKSLELLKQIAPAVVRVALIYNPDNPNSVFYRRISEGASAPLAIELIDLPIHDLPDIERAVTNLADRSNSGSACIESVHKAQRESLHFQHDSLDERLESDSTKRKKGNVSGHFPRVLVG